MLDQIFSKDFEIKKIEIDGVDDLGNDIEVETSFKLKRQISQSDLNDLSINAYRDVEDYLGEHQKQASLLAQFSLIDEFVWHGKKDDLEEMPFITKVHSIKILFKMINDQLRDLKKK